MTNQNPQWFDRRMSIGNLISIVVLVLGMVASWYNLKQAQALQEQSIVGLRMEIARNQERLGKVEAARDDMRERLIRLEIGQSQQNDILREVLIAVKKRD